MDNQDNKCGKENIIRQLVKVQAQVSIMPDVKHGPPKVYCLDSCIKPNPDFCDEECFDRRCWDQECCDYRFYYQNQYNRNCCDSNYSDCCCNNSDYDSVYMLDHECNYTLTQILCIEIPISIDANVDIKEGIACCGRPEIQSAEDTRDIRIEKKKPFYMQMI